MSRLKKYSFIVLLVVLVVFAASWFAGRVQAKSDNAFKSFSLFMDVVAKVRDNYVDEIDVDQLVDDAIRGMLLSLDPHSQYLTPSDYTTLKIDTQGSYGGLGIVIGVRDGFLTVVSPMEGTPASRMGIRSLDKVVAIDGQTTDGLSLDDAVSKMRGPKGTQVTLSIVREGVDKPIDFTLTREVIQVKSIPYAFATPDSIGYVRVAHFSETTDANLEKALRGLESEHIRGLVIDLRRNPGGLLTEGIAVSESFVPKGDLVVSTRGRVPIQNANYYSNSQKVHDGYPIVVLVDGGSASASEIVAGALQDLDLAVLVGERTFGKGSVQSVFPLRDGAALKLTTAKYFTPSGRCIHAEDKRPAIRNAGDIKIGKQPEEKRPEYKTAMGRIVYGGGGITPDVTVSLPKLSAIAENLERNLMFYKFAGDYLGKHKDIKVESFKTSPALTGEFKKFLKDKKFEYQDKDFDADRDYISRAISREIVSQLGGEEAAFKVYIQGDPQVQTAFQLLNKAHSRAELFKVAAAMPAPKEKSAEASSHAEALTE